MTLGLATTAVPFMALSAITSTPVAFVTLVVLGAGVVVFELISVMLLQRLGRRHPGRVRPHRSGEQHRQADRRPRGSLAAPPRPASRRRCSSAGWPSGYSAWHRLAG
jgi:hypothetical protein